MSNTGIRPSRSLKSPEELGVNYIVEGSAQKYGNAFRLRTQLIMAAKESHLWGESYQKKIHDVEDIFKIQSQIAESIAKELKAVITPQEERPYRENTNKRALKPTMLILRASFTGESLQKMILTRQCSTLSWQKKKILDYALAYAGICDVWIGRTATNWSFASPS